MGIIISCNKHNSFNFKIHLFLNSILQILIFNHLLHYNTDMKLDFLVVDQCSFNKTAQQYFLKLHERWAIIYWQKSNQYIWFGFRVGRKHKNPLKHCILDKNKINPPTLSRMKLKLHLGRALKMNLNWILERPPPIRCIIQWLLHVHP